jgi:hypothetical protein
MSLTSKKRFYHFEEAVFCVAQALKLLIVDTNLLGCVDNCLLTSFNGLNKISNFLYL